MFTYMLKERGIILCIKIRKKICHKLLVKWKFSQIYLEIFRVFVTSFSREENDINVML